MNARSKRPSSRQRRRTRRQRCFGTRAFRLTRGSLLSRADAPDPVLRGNTADPPGSARSTGLAARLPPFLAGRTAAFWQHGQVSFFGFPDPPPWSKRIGCTRSIALATGSAVAIVRYPSRRPPTLPSIRRWRSRPPSPTRTSPRSRSVIRRRTSRESGRWRYARLAVAASAGSREALSAASNRSSVSGGTGLTRCASKPASFA